MTIQDGGEYRKLFLNRRKTNQFDHTVVRKAIFTWCRLTAVIVPKRILRFSKSMTSTMFFLLSYFSKRFLEHFSCKIMAAADNFLRFAVTILFAYIGSRNFYTSPDGTWDKGWSATLTRLAYKIARCVAGLKYTATKDFNYQLTVRCPNFWQ